MARAEEVGYDSALPTASDPVMAMKRAIVCLALELPQEVWSDISDRWNDVVREVHRLRFDLEQHADALLNAEGWLRGILDQESTHVIHEDVRRALSEMAQLCEPRRAENVPLGPDYSPTGSGDG